MNIRSAWLHAVGDLLQNAGVMVAAALIWWRPEWQLADPIATLLFSVLIMWTTKARPLDGNPLWCLSEQHVCLNVYVCEWERREKKRGGGGVLPL